ncbi:hypothetical protein HYE82_33870 [Streptomyces sp. BR123]|uniref:hypothetical protein n=1 Tax=Streptomyces sp. BR123 TaxID=2749828 RepID=UPI0015C46BFE|nr:hypothetical protein [Streptomyces sp. BR123]NXY99280.1 hypothetical protein [Streptomyces sp. BR123]
MKRHPASRAAVVNSGPFFFGRPEGLGWLFVDEAGQATPQMARDGMEKALAEAGPARGLPRIP